MEKRQRWSKLAAEWERQKQSFTGAEKTENTGPVRELNYTNVTRPKFRARTYSPTYGLKGE